MNFQDRVNQDLIKARGDLPKQERILVDAARSYAVSWRPPTDVRNPVFRPLIQRSVWRDYCCFFDEYLALYFTS